MKYSGMFDCLYGIAIILAGLVPKPGTAPRLPFIT